MTKRQKLVSLINRTKHKIIKAKKTSQIESLNKKMNLYTFYLQNVHISPKMFLRRQTNGRLKGYSMVLGPRGGGRR